ncbi:MAG: putative sulfate exporter family transporter, partial [Methylococcales bacterium]
MTNPFESGRAAGWRELYRKEDWRAIWLGLGIVILAWIFFGAGSSIKWLAVAPAKWSTFSELGAHFASDFKRYVAQFCMWLMVFCVSMKSMGYRLAEFIPAFGFVFVFAVIIHSIGAWKYAASYNLEAPLVALSLGMLIANFIGLPRWMDSGFRVEYYIKTGIVLLGATLPFTLIVWAGPVA